MKFNETKKFYEKVFNDMVARGIDEFINKEKITNVTDFLKYLVHEKGYLLHGTDLKRPDSIYYLAFF